MQKLEPLDGDKEVTGEFKTAAAATAEAESVTVMVVNGNSEPVTENRDGDDSCEAESNENITQKVDSEIFVKDSVVDSVEPEDFSPSDAVVEVMVEQIQATHDVAEDNDSQSLVETNKDSKVIEETVVPFSGTSDGASPGEADVVSKAIEEIPLASSDDKYEVTPATADVVSKAIEGTELPALEQNPEESSGNADLESMQKVDKSLQEAANAGSVDNVEIPASTENQPVISLRQHNIQPTSWRNCCGLLEILRRSDR